MTIFKAKATNKKITCSYCGGLFKKGDLITIESEYLCKECIKERNSNRKCDCPHRITCEHLIVNKDKSHYCGAK